MYADDTALFSGTVDGLKGSLECLGRWCQD